MPRLIGLKDFFFFFADYYHLASSAGLSLDRNRTSGKRRKMLFDAQAPPQTYFI
jgi:hypothetical protein